MKNTRGRETRAQIIEAAASEFATHGFNEVTITDILQRIGMTQPALYRHFPNKQAIYDELVAEFHEGFNKMIQAARLAPEVQEKDVEQKIQEAVTNIFQFLGANPNLTQIGFIQDTKANVLKEELASLIAENIRYEQQLGFIKEGAAPITVGECLIGIIERLTIRYLFPKEKTPKELAAEVVNLLGPALIKN